MLIWLFLIYVQKQIHVNGLIKIKSLIIFNQLLSPSVIFDTIDLEKHDIWWSANPLLSKFLLTRLISFPSFNLWSSTLIPCGIEITFINLKLNWSQLIYIWICNFIGAVFVNYFWKLNLTTKEILPDWVLKFIQIIVQQDRLLIRVHHALLS